MGIILGYTAGRGTNIRSGGIIVMFKLLVNYIKVSYLTSTYMYGTTK
jgi:hypothetical protein